MLYGNSSSISSGVWTAPTDGAGVWDVKATFYIANPTPGTGVAVTWMLYVDGAKYYTWEYPTNAYEWYTCPCITNVRFNNSSTAYWTLGFTGVNSVRVVSAFWTMTRIAPSYTAA
jgi:hypothetical protein